MKKENERHLVSINIKEENGKQTVSARELHEKLEVGTQFKDWIKRMIEYGFEENVDYVLVAQERATNNPKNPDEALNGYWCYITDMMNRRKIKK